MPGRARHASVGTLAGGLAGYARSTGTVLDRTVESLGGAIGGFGGGLLPDRLEPADSCWHRKGAHAFLPNAIVWSAYAVKVPAIQENLRLRADELRNCSQQTMGLESWLYTIAAALLRFLVGAMSGLPAGYISHVVLDAFTPMGIGFVY